MSEDVKSYKVYRVGGSVRDALLGRDAEDVDFVVVGATAEQLLAQGFTQVPTGFPVFLHPETKAEYALARTETKTGDGFAFNTSPHITLEEDLRRRDFTVNAMAQDENGVIIDPYGGRRDLECKVLRHVSAAFCEDPLRVLRGARFAAQLGFTVAEPTLAVMRAMVERKDLRNLSKERVRMEVTKGFATGRPSHMVSILQTIGALPEIFNNAAMRHFAFAYQDKHLDRLACMDNAMCWPYLLMVLQVEDCAPLGKVLRCGRLEVAVANLAKELPQTALAPEDLSIAEKVDCWTQARVKRAWGTFEAALTICLVRQNKAPAAITRCIGAWRDFHAVLLELDEEAALMDKHGDLPHSVHLRNARIAHAQAHFSKASKD